MRKVGRYILVEELNLEKRHLFSYKERVEDLYKKINEYNNKKDNPYFIGDLTFNWKTRTLYYRRYRKITKPSSLNILDDVTTKLENEASLKKKFKIENDNILFVAYRVNRKIKLQSFLLLFLRVCAFGFDFFCFWFFCLFVCLVGFFFFFFGFSRQGFSA